MSIAPRPVGRHAAPHVSAQPVRAVLLGVIAGALALVVLLPAPGSDTPAPAQVGFAAAPVLPRLDEPRAGRDRPVATLAALAPPPPPAPVDLLPGCTVGSAATSSYANGQIPSRALCALPGRAGHALRADAARALVGLDLAFTAAYGSELCLTDSYRSLRVQRTLARQKPRLAARPGTSEHGWGVAVDLACGAESFGTKTHDWLVANAEAHGWHQPSWARRSGSRPEAWHWELRDR